MIRISFLFVFILGFGKIFAQDNIVTDRPDQAESPLTVPKGAFQFESGILWEQDRPVDEFRENRFYFPTSLFRIGIIDRLELRIVQELSHTETIYSEEKLQSSDFSLNEVGAKLNILNGESLALGILSHAVVSRERDSLEQLYVSSSNKIAISYALSKWNWSLNLGLDYVNAKDQTITGALSVNYLINQRMSLYAELYASNPKGEDLDLRYDNGFTFLLTPNAQLDFSFGTGIDGRSDYVSVGFSQRILAR